MIPFKIKTINHSNDFFFSQLVASADSPENQWLLTIYVEISVKTRSCSYCTFTVIREPKGCEGESS